MIAFPGPGSFTGEDVVELQLHGSPAVCRSVLAALGGIDGLRLAEPGEFTRRALMNGRLDLSQVEGLGDLLAAETAAQQRQALRADGRRAVAAGGGLADASWCGRWPSSRRRIDFADEELPDDVLESVRPGAAASVHAAMQQELRGSRMAERVRDGFEVALVGRPNVGKSTLLNALAGREAALTSEVAGTTRDVIEVRMDLGGLPLTLLDMAGLREAGGRVEALGIARARERAAQADLRVFLVSELGGRGRARGARARRTTRGPGQGGPARARPTRRRCRARPAQGIDALLARIGVVAARSAWRAAGTASHARQRAGDRAGGGRRRGGAARSWSAATRGWSWWRRSCGRPCGRLISWSAGWM